MKKTVSVPLKVLNKSQLKGVDTPSSSVNFQNKEVEVIRFWKNSIFRRYFIIALIMSTLPLMLLTWSYDKFAGQLLGSLEAQKVQHSVNSTYLEMLGFLRNRQYELTAVVELPNIELLLDTANFREIPDNISSLIDFETDNLDTYGVMFFDRKWNLQRALPGQGATGFPYRGEGKLDVTTLPMAELTGELAEIGDFFLIGPQMPSRGASGWFLLAHALNPPNLYQRSPGYVALQIRLASLTELLKPLALNESIIPLLNTPNKDTFTLLGEKVNIKGEQVLYKELASDWSIVGIQATVSSVFTEGLIRTLFIAGVGLSVIMVIALFLSITFRLQRRIRPLIKGADNIAQGKFNIKISPTGNDEITLLAKAFNIMGRQLNELIDSRVLVEKKAVLGEFSVGVAHEIRNPLATMKVCVQDLSCLENDPRSQEQLQIILEEIDRVNEVIEGLLIYGRPMDPKWSNISVSSLFNQAQSLAGPLAAKNNVKIFVTENINQKIYVDGNQLHQVLMNLILNAVQAMPSGGELVLSSQIQGGKVLLEVTDNGVGMSSIQMTKATELFYTTKADGSGLGLAICMRLVHLNSGTLTIDSKEKQGTNIILRFKQVIV